MVLAIRREPLKQLRNAAIWLGLGLALVIGYSFKDDLGSRLLGELVPQRGMANPDGSVTFRAGTDGHFHVEALINGTRLRLLVDTGASQVVLSPSDARRLGIDTAGLDFRHVSETANGPVSGAPVTLREVAVGERAPRRRGGQRERRRDERVPARHDLPVAPLRLRGFW